MIEINNLKRLKEVTQVEISEIKGASAFGIVRSFFEGIATSGASDVDFANTLSESYLGGFPTSTSVNPSSFTHASSFSLGTPGTFSGTF